MPRWPHHPGVQRGGRCLPRCLQSGDPAAAPRQLFGSSNPSPIPPCWAQALAGLRALLLGTVTPLGQAPCLGSAQFEGSSS